MSVSQPHPILHGGGVALACGLDGGISAEEPHGLFAGDTRVLSTWQISVEGMSWSLLSRTTPGPSTAQWDFQNPAIRVPGAEIPAGTLHLRVRRQVSGGMHECLTLRSWHDSPANLRLILLLDADFSDLFEVHEGSMPPRLNAGRTVRPDGVSLVYARGGFRRALHVRFSGAPEPPHFVGVQVVFDVAIAPGSRWSCCMAAEPQVDDRVLRFDGDPHVDEDVPDAGRVHPALEAASPLAAPYACGVQDLTRLRSTGTPPWIAAGAPWFMALFGRDSLVTALMTGMLGRWTAEGGLRELAARQATRDDPFRDAEPGKLPHEERVGELARTGRIPHTPYYGTHDAPALFALTLWNAWRWTGDGELLRDLMPAARAAATWCRDRGDRDGDGLLEYGTRSAKGYRNQGWKDAGDAIVGADGRHASLPIATVELQGYWYAAQLALAELERASGDDAEAARLERDAAALRERVDARFWMEEEGTYALALDGDKRRVASVSSNPGHLLWCGLPRPDRAARVAARMLEDDVYSGWGLRTLSEKNPAFNPLSYQLGSVWPHDTALFAAGLARYGLRAEAARVLRGLLDSAGGFEHHRLPELFCGFPRTAGPPVPYARANSPQAWAAAVGPLAVQLLLGLVPDAPRGRLWVDPHLPEWLPRLAVRELPFAGRTLGLLVERDTAGHVRVTSTDSGGVEVIVATAPPGPLWGAPPG